jgi:hypothetical protein
MKPSWWAVPTLGDILYLIKLSYLYPQMQLSNLKILLLPIMKNVMENKLFDRVFQDRNGRIVLAQMPNLPIITWGVASLLKIIFTTGSIHSGLELIAYGCLFTWAWGELFQGVNYFRRTLGSLVIVSMIINNIP